MALSKERLLKVYRDMVMIRRFEEVIEEYAANGTKRVRQVWWTP